MSSAVLHRQKMHALVLSRRSVGEADRRVTLFTRSHGVLSVMAKGVRKIPSRRGGHLEPFSHVLALISGRGQQLYLSSVESIDDGQQIRQDHGAITHAQTLAQVVLGVCEEGEPYETLFDALHQAYQAFPQATAGKRCVLEAAVSLLALRVTGLAPQLERCLRCQVRIPQDAVVLDADSGGWHCLSCHQSFVGTDASLTPRLLKATRWLSLYPERALRLNVNAEEGKQLLLSLHAYLMNTMRQPITSPAA